MKAANSNRKFIGMVSALAACLLLFVGVLISQSQVGNTYNRDEQSQQAIENVGSGNNQDSGFGGLK